MPGTQKACLVVTRTTAGGIEVLAFRHPVAGHQLVKGTIEAGETVQHAAERELFEESGIAGVAEDRLGTLQIGEPVQEWHFVICKAAQLASSWTHRTADGGGLDFEFFWYPLNLDPDEYWHPTFKQALAFIRQHAERLS